MSEATTTAVAVPEQNAGLSLVEKAMSQNFTPEQLEKLIGLQERVNAHNAKAAFTRALNACQDEIPPIFKGASNPFTRKNYATLEQVMEVVQPIYLAHGFALRFSEQPGEPGWVSLYADLSHVGGHTERFHGRFPLDDAGSKGGSNKSQIQAVGSAFSYGRRYLLSLIFNLVFTDDRCKSEDNDGNRIAQETASAEIISPEQVKELVEMMKRKGTKPANFLAWAGARDYGFLTVAKFKKGMAMLAKKPDVEVAS